MGYNISPIWTIILLLAAVWELTLKGIALWKAARSDESGWFIVILFINSLGILPIIYLLTHRDMHTTDQDSLSRIARGNTTTAESLRASI